MMRRGDQLRFAILALGRHRGRALMLILAISLSVASVLVMTALAHAALQHLGEVRIAAGVVDQIVGIDEVGGRAGVVRHGLIGVGCKAADAWRAR